MRPDAEVVKKGPEAGSASAIPPPKRAGFRRHFEGYELGLVTVGMVLTFALLALPRASIPRTLPLPRVDHEEARRSATDERALALVTEATGLPFEVRAVGEALRRFGRSSARGDDTSHDQDDIATRVAAVFRANEAPLLLRLRAVQTQYFFTALRQFEHDGKPSTELAELGGDFVQHARLSGWLDRSGRLVPDEAALRVLFRLRWAELIGRKATFPFAPSLNEWRIYYRFLLEHPALPPGHAGESATEGDAVRLRLATSLGAKDPDYPLDMARGYLLFQLGDAEAAAVAYRRQLGTHRGGPYALLAQNYLIYTLQGVASE